MSTDVDPVVAANRDYYANMPVRSYRVVLDVDVEWRSDEPDYSVGVIETDLPAAILAYGVRFAAARIRGVEPS